MNKTSKKTMQAEDILDWVSTSISRCEADAYQNDEEETWYTLGPPEVLFRDGSQMWVRDALGREFIVSVRRARGPRRSKR